MQSQILQRIIVKGHSPADTESIFVHTFLAQVHKQFETIETAVVEITPEHITGKEGLEFYKLRK